MSKIKLVINNTNQQGEKEKFFIKKELQSILNLFFFIRYQRSFI